MSAPNFNPDIGAIARSIVRCLRSRSISVAAFSTQAPLPDNVREASLRQLVAAGYVLGCTFVGGGVVPAITLWRWLRRRL